MTITDPLGAELLRIIEHRIDAHPRSQQKRIGPSEIGDECSRALLYKLAEQDEPPGAPKWRATVGAAVHAWLEQAMLAHVADSGVQGWYTEARVSVGHIANVEITGSCDLLPGGDVVDWKTATQTRLKAARLRGMSQKHRIQGHLYGRGWQRRGITPRRVGMFYMPRDGELRDSVFCVEPYDEQVAVDALARCTALMWQLRAFGLDAALTLHPELCDQAHCRWCQRDRARQLASQPRTPGLGELFA